MTKKDERVVTIQANHSINQGWCWIVDDATGRVLYCGLIHETPSKLDKATVHMHPNDYQLCSTKCPEVPKKGMN